MSITAMTIDDHHTNIIKSELNQNNGNLLHKLKSSQTINSNSPSKSKYFVGHDGTDTELISSNTTIQQPSLHLTTAVVTSPKHEKFGINTSNIQITSIENHCRLLEEENQSLKIEQTRLQLQCTDALRRERILMRRLANKEQEFQDYVSQIAEYKLGQAPNAVSLRSTLLDPAVNLLFEKLKNELQATKAKLEETQNELSAWKFTPDSNTGKRLMAKCRLLYLENEELGKMTSNGRLAKLETELAMQKSFSDEVKKSQSELDDFLQELDEDVEGMQSTILFLQQQLKGTKELIHNLEKENYQLKNGILSEDNIKNSQMDEHFVINGSNTPQDNKQISIEHLHTIKEDEKEFEIINIEKDSNKRIKHSNYTNSSTSNIIENNLKQLNLSNEFYKNKVEINHIDKNSLAKTLSDINVECNNDDQLNILKTNLGKRNYDSDSAGSTTSIIQCPAGGINKKIKKKARRSSVLSIDLNYDGNQISSNSSGAVVGNEESTYVNDEGKICRNQRIITRRKSARNHQNGTGEIN